jgi:hypothetical protein
MKNKYTTTSGWVINIRKLKADDFSYLKSLDLGSETTRQEFIDECVGLYLRAWGIDLIDTKASLKNAGLLDEAKKG